MIRFCFVFLFLCCGAVNASEWGRVGYGVSAYSVGIVDPVENVQGDTRFGVLNFYFRKELWRDARYHLHVFSTDGKVDSNPKLRLNYFSRGFSVVFQNMFRLSRDVKPWLGGGLAFASNRFEKRHAIDSEGFLLEKFEDRSESSINLVFGVSTEWIIREDMEIGVNLQYLKPIEGDISMISIDSIIFYQL